jgi:mannose-1-phosphate guanylyltransferase
MYAVILAGGGGTRLHPLSRPEHPKPFLPLVTSETLVQATVGRLAGITDDVTIVTDRRYERLVRTQLPGVQMLLEPLGRNTAAAIALAALAIDDPLVTLGIEVDRPATEYGYLIPDVARGEQIHGLRGYPLRRFEEKPKPAQAEALMQQPGVAWNAGIFLWRRRAILAALRRYTGLLQSLGPMVASPQMLDGAYESIKRAVSIDYAVMESAAQNGSVVMASMDVGWSDLGSWSSLLAAIGARGSGSVVQTGETVSVEADDLVVRRIGGRLGVIAPPERGRMTAAQPIAILRGTGPDRQLVERLLERCSEPEEST